MEINGLGEESHKANFSLGFIISATREKGSFRVNGPVYMKNPKGVDFVFVISV